MASDGIFSISMASLVENVLKEHGARLSDRDLASRKAEEAGNMMQLILDFYSLFVTFIVLASVENAIASQTNAWILMKNDFLAIISSLDWDLRNKLVWISNMSFDLILRETTLFHISILYFFSFFFFLNLLRQNSASFINYIEIIFSYNSNESLDLIMD